MSLQTAFHSAQSALLVNATQTATVSRNIADMNVAGYARRITLAETAPDNGVLVATVQRSADIALRTAALAAKSSAAANQAMTNGLESLQQTVGTPQAESSPAALVGALQTSLTQAASAPQDTSSLNAVVLAAGNLSSALNAASATIQDARRQADVDMSASVDKINSLLDQFGSANTAIVVGKQTGADVSDALDRRDVILGDLSNEIGISTVTGANGDTAIYTDSGATLFQGSARSVKMGATPVFAAGVAGASVYVDGVAVTGPSATMPIQSGALAGLSKVRDVVAPTYQSQLDEIARGLIVAFSQKDQSASPSLPDRTGLFTWSGAPSLSSGSSAGLASDIRLDPTADPSVGGNSSLVRDGGIGASAGAYVYNSTGAASYTARLNALSDGLSAPQGFATGTGLQVSSSVSDLATASVSWLEAKRQQSSDANTQSSALMTQTTSVLSNATGVNIDDQMSQMLFLENSYQASAKMMASIDSMYTSLFNAMTVTQ
jgi:flagellar hook-associated protein 1